MRKFVLLLILSCAVPNLILVSASIFIAPQLPRAGWDVVAVVDHVTRYLIAADVTRALTANITPFDVNAAEPAWSPDGKYIAYTRSVRDNDSPTSLRVYVVESSGRNSRRVSLDGGQGWNPAWSPDGKYIAYSGLYGRSVGTSTVYITTPDGKTLADFSDQLSVLNNFVQAWGEPSNAVDSGLYVLAYGYNSEWGIYRIAPALGQIEQVIDGYYNGAVSYDGRYIALTDSFTDTGIRLLDLEDGSVRSLTPTGSFPHWSSDSQSIIYFDIDEKVLYTVALADGTITQYPYELPLDYASFNLLHMAWRP